MANEEGQTLTQKDNSAQRTVELPMPINVGYNLEARADERRLYANLSKKAPVPVVDFPVGKCFSVEFTGNNSIIAVIENDGKSTVLRSQLSQGVAPLYFVPPTSEANNIALLPRLRSIACREFNKDFGEHASTWQLSITNLDDGSILQLPQNVVDGDPVFMTVGPVVPVIICSSFEAFHIWQLIDEWHYHKVSKRRGLSACCIHPEGTHFVFAGPGGSGVFTIATGLGVTGFDGLWTNLVHSIAFSRSGKLFAATGRTSNSEQVTLLWDWQKNQVLLEKKGGGEAGNWVRISNSEDIMISISDESIVTIWNLKSKSIFACFVTGSKITGGAAFSDNDTLIAVGCDDSIKIYDTETLKMNHVD